MPLNAMINALLYSKHQFKFEPSYGIFYNLYIGAIVVPGGIIFA